MIGWVTLDVGDQALIYDLHGRARIEEGPKRLFLFREKFTELSRLSANQNEFLKVKYIDGKVDHIPGPCSMFRDPSKHTSIDKMQGIPLDANELLVVYSKNEKTKEVMRYLKDGPTIYIPKANEWLHTFNWHGTNPDNKTQKIPGLLKFNKLQVIPDQFYYNVDEVRTADDALMRIKLMIFYELKDIPRMLANTQDPIADFINCVSADVIAFASKYTYMEFIDKSSDLNNLSNYSNLLECCKRIGYEITKVVFRGYFASKMLQDMHDNAMKERTKLKIMSETVEQEEHLTDMKLKNETERAEQERAMEIDKLTHTQKLEKKLIVHTSHEFKTSPEAFQTENELQTPDIRNFISTHPKTDHHMPLTLTIVIVESGSRLEGHE
ncbi:uncharacterized protein LOC141911275 isoform X2 [Tubulanus polymorphus]|uniref:uncharacterized protein LOC141911275 isoform X2 n=1 Tax=Tubulanus polymorphus TaxID=672921 RepID=UPI003DA63B00